jgi:hypothetical protein
MAAILFDQREGFGRCPGRLPRRLPRAFGDGDAEADAFLDQFALELGDTGQYD